MANETHRHASLLHHLYAGHQSWLLGRLKRRLGNAADAEDLTAETFVHVVAHPDPSTIVEPKAFLTTIAKRLVFHFWRRRDLEQAYLDSIAGLPEPALPSEEERALLMEALLRIDQALAGMTPVAKQAFLHSQLDGLTYREIAERLDISLMSVRRYVTQGIARCVAATL